jgi:hypothetical protein
LEQLGNKNGKTFRVRSSSHFVRMP